MAAPLTKQHILTEKDVALLNDLFARRDECKGLKFGGKGSKARRNFLLAVRKLLFVLVLNAFTKDIKMISDFDFARSRSEKELCQIYQQLYVGITLHALTPRGHNLLKDEDGRKFGMDAPFMRQFLDEYLFPKVAEFGGRVENGFDILSMLGHTEKSGKVGEEGEESEPEEQVAVESVGLGVAGLSFDPSKLGLERGDSIKLLASKAKTEYKAWTSLFTETFLDKNGSPKSGKTWDSITNEFLAMIYADQMKKPAGSNLTAWIPTGSNSWLLFILYGPYGRSVFGSTELSYLSDSRLDSRPNPDLGREASRKAVATTTVIPKSKPAITASGDHDSSSFDSASQLYVRKMQIDEIMEVEERRVTTLRETADSLRRLANDAALLDSLLEGKAKEENQRELIESLGKVKEIEKEYMRQIIEMPLKRQRAMQGLDLSGESPPPTVLIGMVPQHQRL